MGKRKAVRAAGGVIVRRQAGEWQVLLIHRDRHDDWTHPKGKLDRGEGHRAAARREIHEETGLTVDLWVRLQDSAYAVGKKRQKVVRWWLCVAPPDATPTVDGDEVSDARWVSLTQARNELTYERDVAVLDEAVTHLARLLPELGAA